MKMVKKIVCVDLDGTLCNDSHRHHLTPQLDKTHTWTDYHMACAKDAPMMGVIIAVQALAKQYGIYIISGREEAAREATIAWLRKYDVPYNELYLRKSDDAVLSKKAYKVQYLASLRRRGLEPVLFLEDWPSVARHIEANGVPVLCVDSRFLKLYNLPIIQERPLGSAQYPPLSSSHLDDIARRLAAMQLPGYPPCHERLFMHMPGLRLEERILIVPEGPWHITNHPNRQGVDPALLDPEAAEQVSAERRAAWQTKGLAIDHLGRPIHPYWRQLLRDSRIGLPTGIGMFYRYGPNPIVDSVVYRWKGKTPEFLLIRQKTSGKWGLPGGFIDAADTSVEAAARRELREESGLDGLEGQGEILWHGLPLRSRDTLNAWTEITVFLFHPDQYDSSGSELVAGDDADRARWVSQSTAASLDLLDTHMAYLALALPRLRPSLAVASSRSAFLKQKKEHETIA